MRKSILSFVCLVFVSLQLWAAEPELAPHHPDRYTVVKGDTLWDISTRFLKNPWLWPEIWQANPQIKNPHLIYPGDVIGLVYVNGKPRITTIKRSPNSGVIKLSPKARITPLTTAIPAIPLDAISSFLSQNRIVTREELNNAPYVLSGKEQHLVSAAGDRIYARGNPGKNEAFGIYRAGEAYVDPKTHEFLGLEAKFVAQANLKSVDGQVMTLDVTRSDQEILQADRLLPTDDRTINTVYMPHAPKRKINGYMISVLGGVSQIGQYNVVVVDKGEREGIKEGDVLAIYKRGGLVRDPVTNEKIELPAERAGLMMIFRTFSKLSYGLILKATRPLSVMDEVRNP
jgi:hypothetical protein